MFNPHNRAPEFMRKLYKKIQKYSIDQINQDADIADYSIEKKAAPRRLRVVKEYSEKELSAAFNEFIYNEPGIQRQKENREATARYTGSESQEKEDDLALKDNLLSLYEFADFPGMPSYFIFHNNTFCLLDTSNAIMLQYNSKTLFQVCFNIVTPKLYLKLML